MRDMDLRAVLKDLAEAFASAEISYALIGGLALTPHGAGRATADLDFLVDRDRADDAESIVLAMGYRRVMRSDDAANYISDDALKGRVDFLWAHREHAVRMLSNAERYSVIGRDDVPVVGIEDLIGLKIQGATSNPVRYFHDLADIQRLLQMGSDINLDRVREYFRIFGREPDLDRLLSMIDRT